MPSAPEVPIRSTRPTPAAATGARDLAGIDDARLAAEHVAGIGRLPVAVAEFEPAEIEDRARKPLGEFAAKERPALELGSNVAPLQSFIGPWLRYRRQPARPSGGGHEKRRGDCDESARCKRAASPLDHGRASKSYPCAPTISTSTKSPARNRDGSHSVR